MTPIRVGRIEVAAADGHVQVAIGDQAIDLDPHGCDDLIHALAAGDEPGQDAQGPGGPLPEATA
jgi:hypothetical protein